MGSWVRWAGVAIVVGVVGLVGLLHFVWDGFAVQLGTVGEWLTAAALGLAGYELVLEQRERRIDRRARAHEALLRRHAAISGLAQKARALDAAARSAHDDFVSWARSSDVHFVGNEIAEGSLDPTEATSKWLALYARCGDLVDDIRAASAVDLPTLTLHLDQIATAIHLEQVTQNAMRMFCQQHGGLAQENQLRSSVLVDFAQERQTTDISPSINVLMTALNNQLDQLRGESMIPNEPATR